MSPLQKGKTVYGQKRRGVTGGVESSARSEMKPLARRTS
jgi:hypothetical protein